METSGVARSLRPGLEDDGLSPGVVGSLGVGLSGEVGIGIFVFGKLLCVGLWWARMNWEACEEVTAAPPPPPGLGKPGTKMRNR